MYCHKEFFSDVLYGIHALLEIRAVWHDTYAVKSSVVIAVYNMTTLFRKKAIVVSMILNIGFGTLHAVAVSVAASHEQQGDTANQ
jgi:hypothetical protein